MKKITTYIFFIAMALSQVACSDDDLSNDSVITIPNTEKNAFDAWLETNYRIPYNLNFQYKAEDSELRNDFTLVPADYKKSIKIAKLVKHLCLEAYDEVAGINFTRTYFPKMIVVIGSPGYYTNGTYVAGEAEGGLKISLYDINSIDETNVAALNENYFHVIHHEFGHILHQTISFSTSFKDISAGNYVADAWSQNSSYWSQGFISAYASSEPQEDFVELLSYYVTNTQEWWDKLLSNYGATSAAIIREKFDVVYDYMLNTWKIDLNELRSVILRRESEIGLLDLDNI